MKGSASVSAGLVPGIPGAHVAGRRDRARGGPALRVLVAEDEAIIALMLSELLEHMGHDVCATVATADAAIAAAAALAPDLMVVDLNLRGSDGMVAAAFGARHGCATILVSGADAALRRLAATHVVLAKPYRQRDLAVAIATAMTRVRG